MKEWCHTGSTKTTLGPSIGGSLLFITRTAITIMMKKSTTLFQLISIIDALVYVESFQPIFSRVGGAPIEKITSVCQIQHNDNKKCKFMHKLPPLQSKSRGENEDDRTGMEDAFSSLNELSSLGSNDDTTKVSQTNIKADIDLLTNLDTSSEKSSEDEIKLYRDLMQELETEGEDGIYDNILDELSISENNSKSTRVFKDVDGIGSLVNDEEEILTAVDISQNTDELMNKALEEAMKEVSVTTSENIDNIDKEIVSLPESILNDEEMMKEINAIFDRANEKLLDGISEIRQEQV